MLLNIFRGIFIIIVLAVLIVSLSDSEISGEPGKSNFNAILWSSVVLVAMALCDVPRSNPRYIISDGTTLDFCA